MNSELGGPEVEGKPKRRRAPLWRTALVSSLSVVVVSLLALYIMAPAQLVLADSLTTSRISSRYSVFYGKVTDTSNRPISNAVVRIYHYSNGKLVYDAFVRTDSRGLYRKVTTRKGTTYMNVSIRAGSKVITSKARKLSVTSGRAYRLNARLVNRSYIVFLPILSY